ncbi:MAG: hypothetical protein IJF17_07125 [Thermoguttaceae bacterium]|nr:hypothetical protein [Thermoguttaceae bacterium]
MKRINFRLLPFFILGMSLSFLVGCGEKGEKGNSEQSGSVVSAEKNVAAEGNSETVQAANQTVVKPKELDKAVEELIQQALKENSELEKLEVPLQMTYFFIRALQTNNEPAIHGMLTQDAYREMKDREGMPCPDFIRNSEVDLGNVQYLSDESDESKIVGARVGTTWHVKTKEGEILEDIAWVFRFEDDAWLAAGMIAILDPKYPPVLVDFEDLEATEKQYAELEKEIERINAENSQQKADVPENEPSGEVEVKEETSVEVKESAEKEEKIEENGADAELPKEISEEIGESEGNENETNEENELPAELPSELP